MKQRDTHGLSQVCIGADYTDEEREFLTAVDRYRRQVRRPILTACDYLAVVRQLGYRRPDYHVSTT